MMDPQTYLQLKHEIAERMKEDYVVLDQLRRAMRSLRHDVRLIQARNTTSIALVATDGGNNSLQFDPFLVQIVRIVDSSNNELCLDVITPTTEVSYLSRMQFHADGSPRTALGELMQFLDVAELSHMSPMIRSNADGRVVSPQWIKVYRELVEWAVLFSLVRTKEFGTDTLIVFDGLLRSVAFVGDLFKRYLEGLYEGIELQWQRNRRKIYLAGVAKHSKVLSRYRLAMALEGVLTTNYPAYLPIPNALEEEAYLWGGYALGEDVQGEHGKANKYAGGKMYFVKFGNGARDPIWPVDIFYRQAGEAQTILGFMLADAANGFPVPLYPLCLQKAHTNAALVDFDFDMLQNHIYDGIRQALGEEASVLDVFRLREADPSQRRYR